MLTARRLGLRFRAAPREAFDDTLASEPDVDVARAVRRFLKAYDEESADAICAFAAREAADNPDLAVFVACGPLRDFAYEADLDDVVDLLLHLDPHDCPIVLHDVVEQLLEHPTKPLNVALVRRAVALDASRYQTLSVTYRLIDEMKRASPDELLLALLDALQIDASTEFRMMHGVDWVLGGLCDAPHSGALGILERCLAHSLPLTVHSPVLMPALGALVARQGEHVSALLRLLVRRAGTVLVVRIFREGHDPETTVRRLHAHAPEVFALWPTRIGPLVGRDHPPAQDDRVIASDGYTYQRDRILARLVASGLSPMTDEPLDARVVSPRM